jgi:hypothetical protein
VFRRLEKGLVCAVLFAAIPEADYMVPEQFSFYGMRLLVSRSTSILEDQGIPLRLAPTP